MNFKNFDHLRIAQQFSQVFSSFFKVETLTLALALLDCCQKQIYEVIGQFNRRLKMTVKPLHDRVLIKRIEEENKTAAGIIIPDQSKDKPSEGEVIAVGDGYTNTDGSTRALSVKVGDKVLFEKWGGSEVKVGGEEYLVMKEEKIIGILQ